MRRPFSYLAVSLSLVVASCVGGGLLSPTTTSPGSSATPDGLFRRGTATITTESETFLLDVEIADTSEARSTGLMHRTTLAPDAGMAFLFHEPDELSFYMRNTLIPLSIAFFDTEGRIVGIFEMLPCESDPCPLTLSPEPAIGALEMNAGWFDRHGVRPGDHVTVQRNGA